MSNADDWMKEKIRDPLRDAIFGEQPEIPESVADPAPAPVPDDKARRREMERKAGRRKGGRTSTVLTGVGELG